MLAIPLPFIMSLLLVIIAVFVKLKQPIEGKLPAFFILLCALSTSIVGLRWSFDVSVLRFIQPIIASLLPVTAWFCFAKAHRANSISTRQWLLHLLGPISIGLSAYFYYLWLEMTDLLLVLLYLVYGLLLLKASFEIPEEVRLSQVTGLLNAERIAAIVLLISALVDSVLSLDFILFDGQHAIWVLSLSYLVLIPVVVVAVLSISFSAYSPEREKEAEAKGENREVVAKTRLKSDELISPVSPSLTEQGAKEIVAKLNCLMLEKEAFKDPDLTLSRLSRKLGIPAKQISIAVNQIYQQNISKVLNEYRINFAKDQLVNSQESITDIYLASGFQSKSNFNREFSRITAQTPSEFRRLSTGAK